MTVGFPVTISFIWSTFDLRAVVKGNILQCGREPGLIRFKTAVRNVSCSLDLLLQGRFEELEQQVLLSLVGGVVIQGEDYGVHELCGFILGHLEDQLGEIRGVGLKGSKILLLWLQLLMIHHSTY